MSPSHSQGQAGISAGRRSADLPPRHAEQLRSQISDGHRLLRSARREPFKLYTRREAAARAVQVDAAYWRDSVIPALRANIGDAAALRVSAAIRRARKNSGLYGMRRPSTAEVITECLWDNKWFKTKADHMRRADLRDRVRGFLRRGEPIHLIFPVFSRKPFSPLKNRGHGADAAEMHSLARCAALAHALNTTSPTGASLTLLADGLKYNRACKTPPGIVHDYQATLREWLASLGADGVVRLVDYEDWTRRHLGERFMAERSCRYAERAEELRQYDSAFDPADPAAGVGLLQADDLGSQLVATFRSIASSVYYEALAELPFASAEQRDDEVDRLYSHYLASLATPLPHPEPVPSSLVPGTDLDELHRRLRTEAWSAARRYVAISLADRDLDVLRLAVPDAIKLTIHGKPGELHYVTGTFREPSMTAQHCTGGYRIENGQAKPTFRYRLDREADGELPVYLAGTDRDAGFQRLARAGQPIAYVTDPRPVFDGRLHRYVHRAGL